MKIKLYEKEQLEFFPIYPYTIDINYAQEKIIRPKGYAYHQIFTVTDGSGIVKANNDIHTVVKGDMFYLGSNTPHEYYGTCKNFKVNFLSFFGKGFENIKKYYQLGDYIISHNKNTSPFETQLINFFENFEMQSNLSSLCVMALSIVTAFFDEVCKIKYSPIETVYKYIENNYFKMLNLDDIMIFYPFSKSKLCHDFKKEYGISIFEMLMETRLKNARCMIESNPNIKLSAVAYYCGFNDTSYFCKMYKRLYGKSPKSMISNGLS